MLSVKASSARSRSHKPYKVYVCGGGGLGGRAFRAYALCGLDWVGYSGTHGLGSNPLVLLHDEPLMDCTQCRCCCCCCCCMLQGAMYLGFSVFIVGWMFQVRQCGAWGGG
jgi:hypothetical protein